MTGCVLVKSLQTPVLYIHTTDPEHAIGRHNWLRQCFSSRDIKTSSDIRLWGESLTWRCRLVQPAGPRRSQTRHSKVLTGIDGSEEVVVQGCKAADGREVLGAPDAAELHPRVVGLAALPKPVVPIVAPTASRLQHQRQAAAAILARAAPVAVVTIEVTRRKSRVLRCTTTEDPLTSTRDLDVEAMSAGYIVADVGDLHDHGLVHQASMRSAPNGTTMHPVHEAELVALGTIVVARKPVAATDCSSSKAECQAGTYEEGLVAMAAGGAATVTHGPRIAVPH